MSSARLALLLRLRFGDPALRHPVLEQRHVARPSISLRPAAAWRRSTSARSSGGLTSGAGASASCGSAGASLSASPSRSLPVFARNTSSREGESPEVRERDAGGVQRPDHLRQRARIAAQLIGDRVRQVRRTRQALAEAAEDLIDAVAVAVELRDDLDPLGAPTSALSSVGVPSATRRPRLMIEMRSARASASSRYCVVRKTVTPSCFASRRTSSHSAARLWGSRPVVALSRKTIRGACTSASARSSRLFIPPEYVPTRLALRPPTDRRVRGAPLRVSALRRTCSRASLPGAGRAPWRSAAGRARPPAAPPRSGGVPRPPRATSCPPTRACPHVLRRQQRDEHLDRRALPCAVRARILVDLAFVHVQIDPVDRARSSSELPDELVNLDRVLGNLWRSLGCLQWLLALRASRLESIIFRPTLSFVARVLRSPRW